MKNFQFRNISYYVNIHGESKKFGEWCPEKKEDTNELTIYTFKMILILYKTQLATFIKASGKCQERPV
jgi:hypothetical protein